MGTRRTQYIFKFSSCPRIHFIRFDPFPPVTIFCFTYLHNHLAYLSKVQLKLPTQVVTEALDSARTKIDRLQKEKTEWIERLRDTQHELSVVTEQNAVLQVCCAALYFTSLTYVSVFNQNYFTNNIFTVFVIKDSYSYYTK